MPSEHAAFAFFLALHCSQHLHRHVYCPTLIKMTVIALLWTWAGLVTFSRAHMGVHSEAQLAVGAALGVAYSLAWFRLELALSAPLARAQRLADAAWRGLGISWRECGGDPSGKGD
ncbi:unnamed protein product [Prorocentrum cordatum]|uniref:Dolichyldiphosphatase n=1 Tax=Prorocentrum cordatum TaxID=2364126 RepID=A0ABN9UVH0_9DINO|nr:unnamed protein product [Polarella glacialis]